MNAVQTGASLKVLVIDVGGTNIKLLATGQKDARKIRLPTIPACVENFGPAKF